MHLKIYNKIHQKQTTDMSSVLQFVNFWLRV